MERTFTKVFLYHETPISIRLFECQETKCLISIYLNIVDPALVRLSLVNYDCIKFHCNGSDLTYCISTISVGNKEDHFGSEDGRHCIKLQTQKISSHRN